MDIDMERIASVAANECVRQQVGIPELTNLLKAYDYALSRQDHFPVEYEIIMLGMTIEPVQNVHGYRTTPVSFSDTSTAVDWRDIDGAMIRLVQNADPDVEWMVNAIVKAFLDIHPFCDGNGRTAWILYNWYRKTLANPDPLPNYYG